MNLHSDKYPNFFLQGEADEATSEDASVTQASRGKLTLLKKKLEEKDKIIVEKDELIKIREQQIEAKERVLAERDTFVGSLTEQLEEKTKTIEDLQLGRTHAGGDGDSEEVSTSFSTFNMLLCNINMIVHFGFPPINNSLNVT